MVRSPLRVVAQYLRIPTPLGDRRGPREDGGYRRRDDGEKKVGPGADFKPDFRSGFGRSAPVETQQ